MEEILQTDDRPLAVYLKKKEKKRKKDELMILAKTQITYKLNINF